MGKEDTIRKYKDEVTINFKDGGESFTLDVPHKGKWLAIIRFLKGRGFSMGVNAYYKEHYDSLSMYHKFGYKGDVACMMEIRHSSIVVKFGNAKNLWPLDTSSFVCDYHDKYTQLSYLEGLAVKLEIKRLLEFCGKYNHVMDIEEGTLTPAERIIHKLSNNTHIHGKVECLEDIKVDIGVSGSDYDYNSNDKDNKKIICGDMKCFYDYSTRRIFMGEVWHNINNMWWVIINGKMSNIASFNLFDYSNDLPKRKPITANGIEALLSKFSAKREYKRCMGMMKQLEKQTKQNS